MARSTIRKWQNAAAALKGEALALYFALRHPRTPWHAKALAACVVAYAFSPIDFIPDFVPVLGYMDDLVLVSLGVGLAKRLIPSEVMVECRAQAQRTMDRVKPVIWTAAVFIVVFWVLAIAFIIRALVAHFARG